MVEANFQAACGALLDDSQNRRNGGCFLTRNTTVEVENGWASFSHIPCNAQIHCAIPRGYRKSTLSIWYIFPFVVVSSQKRWFSIAMFDYWPGSRMKLTGTQGQCLQPSSIPSLHFTSEPFDPQVISLNLIHVFWHILPVPSVPSMSFNNK